MFGKRATLKICIRISTCFEISLSAEFPQQLFRPVMLCESNDIQSFGIQRITERGAFVLFCSGEIS